MWDTGWVLSKLINIIIIIIIGVWKGIKSLENIRFNWIMVSVWAGLEDVGRVDKHNNHSAIDFNLSESPGFKCLNESFPRRSSSRPVCDLLVKREKYSW